MVSGIEEGQGCHLYYEVWTQSCPGMTCSRTYNTDEMIPVPPQFQIPSSCQLNMSTHELELMLFINKNFLSPSIYDKVMKWAHSATAKGYKFNSPSYSTLRKQNKWTTHSPILLMVMVLSNLGLFTRRGWIRPPSDNVVLWAFLWSCLQSPSKILKSWMTLFVLFSPEEIYWLWIMCVQ